MGLEPADAADYAGRMREQGFDGPRFLHCLSEEAAESLATAVGMKPVHAAQFRQQWRAEVRMLLSSLLSTYVSCSMRTASCMGR